MLRGVVSIGMCEQYRTSVGL